MKRAPNPYARAWDLRVACALISLDIVDPFLSDLGFGRHDGAAARRVARKYLVAWDTASNEAPDAWLGSVRTNAGKAVVDRVAQLADALAHPGPSDLAWIELMVKVRDGVGSGSDPGTPSKLEWFRAAGLAFLAESDHIDQRLDALVEPVTEWDVSLLSEDFYPLDSDEDPDSGRFDPRSWLSMHMRKRRWQRFRDLLRESLSVQEVDELVSWGNSVIVGRWTLSSP